LRAFSRGEITAHAVVDATKAKAELASLNMSIERIDGETVTVNADFDGASAIAGMVAFRAAATAIVGAVGAMDRGLSAGGVRIAMMGGLAATAAALFTPLLGALASVGALGAAAGAGIAMVAGPLVAVISRLQEYHQSLDQVSSAQSSARSSAESLASANRTVESAERSRTQTLEQLETSTEALELAQRDLNYALEDEPLNQESSEIELARARDRLEETTTAYNEAVEKYGANSEQARDAALDLREAENDLALQQNETTRVRKDGTQTLQAAQAAEESAADGVASAETAVADATRAVADAQRQAAAAATALAEAEQGVLDKVVELTPAQKRLYDVAIATGAALNKAFTPAQDAVSRLGVAVLRDVTPAFRVLNNVAVAVIRELGGAWDSLVRKMQLPEQRENTTALLGITPEVINSLARAAGNVALTLGNIFGNAAPAALALGNEIRRITLAMLQWSRSAEGAQNVRTAIAAAVPIFRSLWNLVIQVGAALFEFGVTNSGAVARAIDILTFGLTALIKAFSWLTRTFGPIIPLTAALAPVFLALMLVVGQLGSALFSLITVVPMIVTAFGSVAAVFTGPVLLAIAAFAAAAFLIYKNWGRISQVFAPVIPTLNRVRVGIQNFVTVVRGLLTGDTGTEQFKRAFAALPGPVQTAIKRVVIVVRSLVNGLKQAWAQIRPIVTAVGNGISKGLTTAFRFLAGQLNQLWNAFKRAWPGIRNAVMPVVTAVARVLRGALGAAFKFAIQQANVVVNWFKKNWPLIKRTAEVVFNGVKTVITTVMRASWAVIKAVLGPLVAFWRKNWTTIRAILVAVWNIIKTTISTAIKVVLGIIKATMQIITGDWRGAWETIKGILSTVWQAMLSNVKNVVEILKNTLKLAWEAIKSVAGAAWDGIKSAIAERVTGILENIKGFVEDLKSALNTVLGLVGLPKLGEGDDKSENVKGAGGGGRGSRRGRSADVKGFAEGGRVDARPGGMYRVAEAGADEWVINPKSRNYERHLRGAAAEGGFRVVRKATGRRGHRGGGQPRVSARNSRGLFPPWRAFGAEALGPTMHSYIPEMRKFVDDANAKFPIYTNTYSNHPPGYEQPYYRERSVDFWGTGGRGSDLSDALHEQTVPYTIDALGSNLNWLISNGRMLTSQGWGPDTSGYDHYSHQHTTAFADGPSAGGAGSGGNLRMTIFDAAWKRLVEPLVDSVLEPLSSSSFIPAKAAGAGGEKIVGSIKNWIVEQIGGLTDMGGGEGLSGTPQENRQLGQKMFPDSGLDGSFSSVDAIWTQESGWDETADNPTSTAFGIPQFLDSTWEQYGGISYDAEGQIRKGYAYIGDRYNGSADEALQFKQANGWYDRGGMITRQHQAIVDPGELYLPLESRQVQKSAQTALGTAELRSENARYHRELMHRLGSVGLANETIRQQAVVARAATVGTLYSRDGLEAHSTNALRAERRDRMASV
jgi:phage-related protein